MNPLKQKPIDKWSIREKLSLASSVKTAGDQNWYSVSRSLKPFGETNRPQDWFSQKNCASQYNELLENVETPKRKRGEKNEDTVENLIFRKLTLERIEELKNIIEKEVEEIKKYKKNVDLLKINNLSDTDFKILEKQMLDTLDQAKKDEEDHQEWLKEREQKYAALLLNKKKIPSFNLSKNKKDLNQSTASTPATPTSANISTMDDDSVSMLEINKNIISTLSEEVSSSNNPLSSNVTSNVVETIKSIDTKNQVEKEGLKNVSKADDFDKIDNSDIKNQTDKVSLEKNVENKSNSEFKETSKAIKLEEIESNQKEKQSIKVDQDNFEVETKSKNNEKEEKRVIKEINESNESAENNESNKNIEDKNNENKAEPSNKRKRTSTLSNPVTPVPAPTSTRRSGRFKTLVRTPKPETDSKKLPEETLQNVASQITNILNDDSTKDSTTSDVTDTYTSPNSPASSILNIDQNDPEQVKEQKEIREYKAWKKSILLLWRQAATHKYSSLFTSPVTDEEAKGYSTVVYKPIDLTMIKKKIENGTIKNTLEFQRDIMLMFQNAIMYNNAKHEVHQMAVEMQKEILEAIEDFINSSSSNTPLSLKEPLNSRRKSRTL